MKKIHLILMVVLMLASISFQSCFKDLDLNPVNGTDAVDVYENASNYIHVLASISTTIKIKCIFFISEKI